MRELKRFLSLALLPLLSAVSVLGSAPQRLAVFDLMGEEVDSLDAAAATRFLVTDIVKTGKFIVLDRANIERILGEQAFQRSGVTSPDDAARLGRLLNVQKILLGSLLKLGGEYYLNVNVVDVETAAIVLAARERCRSMDELPQLTEKIAEQLAQMVIPPEIEALAKEPEPTPAERELAWWTSSGLSRADYFAYKKSGSPLNQWVLTQEKSPAAALSLGLVPVVSGLYYTGDTGWGIFASLAELLVTVGAVSQTERRPAYIGALVGLTAGDAILSWWKARERNQKLSRVARDAKRVPWLEKQEEEGRR